MLLWGPSFVFAAAQAEEDVLLGTRGDTSTAGLSSAHCQQPVPQGTSTAGQNSVSLLGVASTTGVQPAELP